MLFIILGIVACYILLGLLTFSVLISDKEYIRDGKLDTNCYEFKQALPFNVGVSVVWPLFWVFIIVFYFSLTVYKYLLTPFGRGSLWAAKQIIKAQLYMQNYKENKRKAKEELERQAEEEKLQQDLLTMPRDPDKYSAPQTTWS